MHAYTFPIMKLRCDTCIDRTPQGYTDNSGLGPILAQYLRDESNKGQILVLVINELGDHQIDSYFNATGESGGGMICEGEASMDEVFSKIKKMQQKSFQDIGGEYIERDGNEKTCAFRLASTMFFKVL